MNYFIIPGLKYRDKVQTRTLTADIIIEVVCRHYKTTYEKLCTKNRANNVVMPRMVCMYFLKKYTTLALREIGDMFGNRDHTTVIHMIDRANELIETGDSLKDDIESIAFKFV